MKYLSADAPKPLPSSLLVPGHRRAHRTRLVMGGAIALGGAAVLLADTMRVLAAFA